MLLVPSRCALFLWEFPVQPESETDLSVDAHLQMIIGRKVSSYPISFPTTSSRTNQQPQIVQQKIRMGEDGEMAVVVTKTI